MLDSARGNIGPRRIADPPHPPHLVFPQLLPPSRGPPSSRAPRRGRVPFFLGNNASAVASVLCLDLERCPRSRSLCRRTLCFVAGAYRCVQGGLVFFHPPAVRAGCCLCEFGHPQVSHGIAPGKWRPLGLGGLFPRCRLLPWILHACVELCPGAPSPLPSTGTDFARTGTRPLDG